MTTSRNRVGRTTPGLRNVTGKIDVVDGQANLGSDKLILELADGRRWEFSLPNVMHPIPEATQSNRQATRYQLGRQRGRLHSLLRPTPYAPGRRAARKATGEAMRKLFK